MSTNPIATGETAGHRNLQHALRDNCTDPDCELHHPEVIEDGAGRLTAVAWFILGMRRGAEAVHVSIDTRSSIEDTIHNIVDEALAPQHPGADLENGPSADEARDAPPCHNAVYDDLTPEARPRGFGESTT